MAREEYNLPAHQRKLRAPAPESRWHHHHKKTLRDSAWYGKPQGRTRYFWGTSWGSSHRRGRIWKWGTGKPLRAACLVRRGRHIRRTVSQFAFKSGVKKTRFLLPLTARRNLVFYPLLLLVLFFYSFITSHPSAFPACTGSFLPALSIFPSPSQGPRKHLLIISNLRRKWNLLLQIFLVEILPEAAMPQALLSPWCVSLCSCCFRISFHIPVNPSASPFRHVLLHSFVVCIRIVAPKIFKKIIGIWNSSGWWQWEQLIFS